MGRIQPISWYVEDNHLEFHLLDVGEGLMTLIIFPDNKVMLFDCNVTDENKEEILTYLDKVLPEKYSAEKGEFERGHLTPHHPVPQLFLGIGPRLLPGDQYIPGSRYRRKSSRQRRRIRRQTGPTTDAKVCRIRIVNSTLGTAQNNLPHKFSSRGSRII